MKTPKSVKIGPLRFSVTTFKPENEAIGDVSFNECRIRIANTCKQVQQETLLHECMHMLFFICGRKELADDEQLVSAISPQLLCMLRDNPDMVKYLMEQKKETT